MGTDTKYDKPLRMKNTLIISLLVTKMGKRNCCLNINFTWEMSAIRTSSDPLTVSPACNDGTTLDPESPPETKRSTAEETSNPSPRISDKLTNPNSDDESITISFLFSNVLEDNPMSMTPDNIIRACKAYLKKNLQHLCRDQQKQIVNSLKKLAISAATLSTHFNQAPPIVHANTTCISHVQCDGKNLVLFHNNFLTTMLSRRQWSNLLKITTLSGIQKNVLQNFMSITDDKILLAKASSSAQENTSTINIVRQSNTLEMEWLCSITPSASTSGSAESVIHNKLQQFNNPPAKFKELQFNVAAFSDYIVNCVKELEAAGGKDKQAPDKLTKALTTSPCAEFNSNICSHCSACCTNSTPLDIDT
eukprot:15365079-Ditylum_brightwellii.AAC.2